LISSSRPGRPGSLHHCVLVRPRAICPRLALPVLGPPGGRGVEDAAVCVRPPMSATGLDHRLAPLGVLFRLDVLRPHGERVAPIDARSTALRLTAAERHELPGGRLPRPEISSAGTRARRTPSISSGTSSRATSRRARSAAPTPRRAGRGEHRRTGQAAPGLRRGSAERLASRLGVCTGGRSGPASPRGVL
jgi:hypothetical protein